MLNERGLLSKKSVADSLELEDNLEIPNINLLEILMQDLDMKHVMAKLVQQLLQ